MGTFGRATALSLMIGSVLLPPHAAAAQTENRRVVIAVMPRAEAAKVLKTHAARVGLGVFPESRDPRAFLEEIGFGAPHGRDISSGGEKPRRVSDALAAAGITIAWTNKASPMVGPLRAAFPQSPGLHSNSANSQLTIHFVDRADELSETIRVIPRATGFVIFGFGEETPLLVGICRSPCDSSRGSGLVDGGITRRPGLVTPYDVGATVMEMLGVPRPADAFIGKALTVERKEQPFAYIETLERRLVGDESAGSTAAVVTDTIMVAVLLCGTFLVWAGEKRVAARGVQGGWMAVAVGYPISRFLTTGNGMLRAIPVVVAFVLGVGLSPQRSTRNARIFFGIALGTAVMFVVATLNPGGEPGLSIWGNPLTSWRFFGMQNAWAATIAGGVVVWGVLAGLGTAALIVVAAAVAVLIGAPTIGANFVGVLTFAFGVALAALALVRGKVKPVHVVIAGAAALVAFFLALLADVGSPVSHGGRAAKSISDDGISTAWDYVTGRIRLNVDLIRDFWGGPIWVVLFLITLVVLAKWGSKANEGPLRARAAVWGGAAMALASFVLEDSGFFSGTTLLGATLAGWIVNAAISSGWSGRAAGAG